MVFLVLAYFSVALAEPNVLAGVEVGGVFNSAGWQCDSTTCGKEVTYAGFQAAMTVEPRDGRTPNPAMGYLVAHPTRGSISPLQPGLTESATPGETALRIASAVRDQLRSEGFVDSGDRNPRSPNVEHWCATGNRERTLNIRTEVPGSFLIVMVGAPNPSTCP
jgi:hypothetical protein